MGRRTDGCGGSDDAAGGLSVLDGEEGRSDESEASRRDVRAHATDPIISTSSHYPLSMHSLPVSSRSAGREVSRGSKVGSLSEEQPGVSVRSSTSDRTRSSVVGDRRASAGDKGGVAAGSCGTLEAVREVVTVVSLQYNRVSTSKLY